MTEPMVSVIVPVYNVEQYLPQCVDSILSQTYQNLEIVLVDDGSTDGSGKICDEFPALSMGTMIPSSPSSSWLAEVA